MEARLIMLPTDPGFYHWLGLPPNWEDVASRTNGEFAVVNRIDTGVLEAVPWQEAEDYIWGGELDELEGEEDATEY